MRRKIPFTIFKYLFSFQRYSNFSNMQIREMMTSSTRQNFDKYNEKWYLSPFLSEMFDFLQLGHIKWCASQWKLNSFVTMATYRIPDLPKIKMWRQTINMINKHKWNSENCPERDLNPLPLYFTGFNLRVYNKTNNSLPGERRFEVPNLRRTDKVY